METNNLNTNLELEEMRAQFAILQQRLDEQVHINEQQLRKAVSTGIGQMRTRDRAAVAISFFGWIAIALYAYTMNFSLAFQLFLNIFMCINFVSSVVMKLHINDFNTNEMASSNLLRTSQELLRYKRFNQRYLLFVSIPFIMVFIPWYCYEMMMKINGSTTQDFMSLLIPVLIGAAVGVSIGLYKFYFPSVRQATDMLEKIQELQKA